jgi:hypothetical protein
VRHGLRGAVTAWLSLIALQAVVANGSGQVAGALSAVAGLVNRALSPNVAAIPDRRTGALANTPGATTDVSTPYVTPPDLRPENRPAGSSPAVIVPKNMR